jgi:white-opaque regulator 2
MVEHPDNNRHFRPPHYSERGSPMDQRSPHLSTPSPTFPNAPLPPMTSYGNPPQRSTPTSYPTTYASQVPSSYPPYPMPPQNGRPDYPAIPTSGPMNLPPMRPGMNGLQPPSVGIGAPLPSLNGSSLYGYPGNPQLPPPSGITSAPMHNMRTYPMQMGQMGTEQRVMSGGRHKKEIKRRTKTGCLTCRKRRIKVCALGESHADQTLGRMLTGIQ